MTNYPKDEESSFKNEKNKSNSFFEEIFELKKSIKFVKEKWGGAIFKTPPFGARCTNLTQFYFLKLRN